MIPSSQSGNSTFSQRRFVFLLPFTAPDCWLTWFLSSWFVLYSKLVSQTFVIVVISADHHPLARLDDVITAGQSDD